VEEGRKPFSKGNVKELLANNVGAGISFAIANGYEIFRGVHVDDGFLAEGDARKVTA